MIYGLIPIGGKGTRLGLPYSKEMLPQKNYDIYNPVVNHLVEKMLLAGAGCIVFVHGLDYKEDVREYFNEEKYVHILQNELGFANVLKDFFNQIETNDEDKVLFGLPDSVFNANPFVEMLHHDGIVAGCFTTSPYTKVDRLRINEAGTYVFQVKVSKNESNQDYFWGVIKFDILNILRMIEDDAFKNTSEIGTLLNQYGFKTIKGDKYLDLGTWEGYNRYLTSDEIGANNEIEKKYDASNIEPEDFYNTFLAKTDSKLIASRDYYFTISNPNVEFVRYREKSIDDGSVPDITIKNYNSSQFNRFELTVPISNEATTHNVLHLLSILGAEFKFDVVKQCIIFEFEKFTLVYYSFEVKGQTKRVIEVELKKADFNNLYEAEQWLSQLPGFNPSAIIKQSKFQMIKEIYDSSH